MSIFKGWPTLTEIFFGKQPKAPVKKVAPKVATKTKAKATPKAMATPAKPTKKALAKMTKKDLEKMGRKHGIELDRRLSKDKLVKQLHKSL
jgi:hypothetical protein